VINTITNSNNFIPIIPYFKCNLIVTDPEDNKFADCALNAGANYIVTNDKHFNILKEMNFPYVKVVNIETFKLILTQ
jgi:predicted nucleic acid-binding protein